jgi:poly-gamma-glutamate synthase PgsB/CapB
MVENRIVFSGSLVVITVLLLLVERLKLTKKRQQIFLRICITGTRGKSSVTRLIAGSLREAGKKVIAKTTGSRPVLIYPDGSESLIARKGRPNILETKEIINQAARSGVDVLVTELMSINPECMYSESVQILDPSILVFTNIRPDHQEQWGYSKASLLKTFTRAVPEKCVLFLPEEERKYFSVKRAVPSGVEIKFVGQDQGEDINAWINTSFPNEFKQNISLALAVAESMGIESETALRGMERARPDFGSLKTWKVVWSFAEKKYLAISAFAANDPQSTQIVMNKIKECGLGDKKKIIGILNLREDRADRTVQWLREFRAGRIRGIDRLILTGAHAAAFKRRLKPPGSLEVEVLKEQDPDLFLNTILERDRGEDVLLLGMGNMQGMGSSLVEYWDKRGVSYDL